MTWELKNSIFDKLPTRQAMDFHREEGSDSRQASLSLKSFAQYLAKEIEEECHNVVAFALIYSRHAFATDPLPVWLAVPSGREEFAETLLDIMARNWLSGLQPLPVVLDSITRGRRVVITDLVFGTLGRECLATVAPIECTQLDTAKTERRPGFFAARMRLNPNAEIDVATGAGGKVISSPVFLSADRERTAFADYSGWRAYYDENPHILAAFSGTAAKLCCCLGARPGPLVQRSIAAALQSSYRYWEADKSKHARQIAIIYKGQGPLDLGFGASLFLEDNDDLANDVIERVRKVMKATKDIVARRDRESLKDVGLAQVAGYKWQVATASPLPSDIANDILSALSSNKPQSKPLGKEDYELHVHHFLAFCCEFCDERLEGQELEYGVLLGDPFLTRYWPGELPLPVSRGEHVEEYFTVDEVASAVNISTDPAYRCLVVPYGANYEPNNSKGEKFIKAPLYGLDLADFRAAIDSWPLSRLWTLTSAIYAFITMQAPWTVAAVVGPGSRVLVIAGGTVVAMRDGRGWRRKIRVDGGSDSWQGVERDTLQVLTELLKISEQTSRFVRPNAHGSFLVYTPRACADLAVETREEYISFQPLHRGELTRLDSSRWLEGQAALVERDGELRLSPGVANRIIRASRLDGAVCLEGPQAKVFGYAQRLTPMAQGGRLLLGGESGTKRATAKAFAQQAGPGAFAIATSSDGPVRVYLNRGDREPQPVEVFKIAQIQPGSGFRFR